MKIGLPKGNLLEESLRIITTMTGGLSHDGLLYYITPDKRYQFYLLKRQDIPQLVVNGRLDYGITSQEWIAETEVNINVLKQLDWEHTRICLLAPHDSFPSGMEDAITCVTEFPHIAKKYFELKEWRNVTIEQVTGSCEGLVPSVFDCAIDCVQTGRTANTHELAEHEVILTSTTVLITQESNRDFDSMRRIKELVDG